MNKRQKKKLAKRDGHFHYKKYRYWKRVWELAENKYGKENVEAWKIEAEENKTGYKRNMICIITNRKLWPINVTLFRNVFPGSISSDFDGDTLSTLFLDNKEKKND